MVSKIAASNNENPKASDLKLEGKIKALLALKAQLCQLRYVTQKCYVFELLILACVCGVRVYIRRRLYYHHL